MKKEWNLKAMRAMNILAEILQDTTDNAEMGQKVTDLIVEELPFSAAGYFDINGKFLKFSLKDQQKSRWTLAKEISKAMNSRGVSRLLKSKNLLNKAIKTKKMQIAHSYAEMYSPPLPIKIAELLDKKVNFTDHIVVPCVANKRVEGLIVFGLEKKMGLVSEMLAEIIGKKIGFILQNRKLFSNIQKENQELINILNSSVDGFFIYKELKVHYISPKLSIISEYSPQEISSYDKIISMIVPEEREKVKQIASERRITGNMNIKFNTIVKTKTGRKVPILVKSMPITYQGEKMLLISIEDISAEKKTANKIQAMYQNQATLFSEIAHSLNTPFTIIKGLIELNIGSIKDERSAELFHMIEEEVETASKKISQLLKVAKFDLQQFEPKYTIISSHSFIEAAYTKAKALGYKYCDQTHSSDCECLSIKDNDNVTLRIDTDALMDVFTTIIENAYKYSPVKGEKAKINISSKRIKHNLQITISDKGVGIREKELQEIFDPFSQVKKMPDRHGIGLPMCKKIIEQLGGKITVKSKIKKGTSFKIVLPIYS